MVFCFPIPPLLGWLGASEGLRTLLIAKTERSEEQYSKWLAGFQAAETSMQGREEKVRREHTLDPPCRLFLSAKTL